VVVDPLTTEAAQRETAVPIVSTMIGEMISIAGTNRRSIPIKSIEERALRCPLFILTYGVLPHCVDTSAAAAPPPAAHTLITPRERRSLLSP